MMIANLGGVIASRLLMPSSLLATRGRRNTLRTVLLCAGLALYRSGVATAESGQEGSALPDYSSWKPSEEATTYRPGTDLRFYPLEMRVYDNPQDPTDRIVTLSRQGHLYILYHYVFAGDTPRWEIFMDAGFADAPCGFFDPEGHPTGRYTRIDLKCLRPEERIDLP